MTTPQPTDEVRQVVVHPAIWQHLEAWLLHRGLVLCLMPPTADDLPTYVMQPTAELMAAIRPEAVRDRPQSSAIVRDTAQEGR